MMILEVGESITVPEIKAAEYWNSTNINLEVTAIYALEVQGEQFWYDWFIQADANGYTRPWLKWVEGLRRCPSENWFALIGSISQNSRHNFLIGKGINNYKPPLTGNLYCYANDVPFMYWNNKGSLSLTVTRVR